MADPGQVVPPSTPLVDSRGMVTPPWYRYFSQRKRIEDGSASAGVLTTDNAAYAFPAGRRLAVDSGELTATDNGTTFSIGLAASGVPAGARGGAAKLVVLTVDAFGRVTGASEVDLQSGNVAETTNLFFTNARARSAISGGSGINYNSGTGAISTSGFSGGPAAYTNFTFVNGICTAAS